MTPPPRHFALGDRRAQAAGGALASQNGKPVSSLFPPAFQLPFFPTFQGDVGRHRGERGDPAETARPGSARARVEAVAGRLPAAALTFADPSLYMFPDRPTPPPQEPRR